LEGARIVLVTSGIFLEKRLKYFFGNFSELPEMFRSCRKCFGYFSQMKIIDPEMFWNASKIILGGAGNVLGLQKFFRIFRTRKSGVMNSEKY